MSKTPASKQAYAMRRELRLRRDKTAMMLMPFFLHENRPEDGLLGATISERLDSWEKAARDAVSVADMLLAQLDRTRVDLAPGNALTEDAS